MPYVAKRCGTLPFQCYAIAWAMLRQCFPNLLGKFLPIMCCVVHCGNGCILNTGPEDVCCSLLNIEWAISTLHGSLIKQIPRHANHVANHDAT